MNKAVLALCVFLLLAPPAVAGEFSLFGVKLGMTREEVAQVWAELESGEFYVKDSVLFNVRPEFDHAGRMYKLTFSVPSPEEYPAHLTAVAFQGLVRRLWGGDAAISVNVRAGKGSFETTVVHTKMQEEYVSAIETELSVMFRP